MRKGRAKWRKDEEGGKKKTGEGMERREKLARGGFREDSREAIRTEKVWGNMEEEEGKESHIELRASADGFGRKKKEKDGKEKDRAIGEEGRGAEERPEKRISYVGGLEEGRIGQFRKEKG